MAVRCDMNNFSRFRSNLGKSKRPILEEVMINLCNKVIEEFPVVEVFSFSDEINIVVPSSLYDGRVSKIITYISSYLSAHLTEEFKKVGIRKVKYFDGRMAIAGTLDTVHKYIVFRQLMVERHGWCKATGLRIGLSDCTDEEFLRKTRNPSARIRYEQLSDFSRKGYYKKGAPVNEKN